MHLTSGTSRVLSLLLVVSVLLSACGLGISATPIPTLILRNWEGDISQDIPDAFTEETGIPLDAEIRNNPAIFPPQAMLQGAEVLLPLSAEGEHLHQTMWDQVLEARQ